MSTKEELVAYLKANRETELPFNEEVWNLAVEKTADKERKFKTKIETDYDGNVKTKQIPNGVINPVGKYFALMALPQYQKPITVEDRSEIDNSCPDDEDFNFQEDDEEKNQTVSSWLNTFFSGYDNDDKKFLKERLSDYYDNYEINEGADKLLVVMAVTDELEVMNLTKLRAKGKDVEARLEKVRKGYLSSLEGLKALKKQRGAMEDESKNKFTLWVDELAKEGVFKTMPVNYDEDAIDKMLATFERSMLQVLREG